MAETGEQTLPKILFYDIDNTLPYKIHPRSWSPATIRTLLALKHRNLPYERITVSYPDIHPVLASKGVPPLPIKGNAKYPVYHTLPAIGLIYQDGKEKTIMDSDPIAKKLESLVPVSENHPSLFPLSQAETQRLDAEVRRVGHAAIEGIVRSVVPWVPLFLDERGQEYFYRTRKLTFGMELEDIRKEEDQSTLFERFKEALSGIAKFYAEEKKRAGGEGVFLGGRQGPWNADFIVVAVLEWFRCARGEEIVDKAMEEVEGGILLKMFRGLEKSLDGYQ